MTCPMLGDVGCARASRTQAYSEACLCLLGFTEDAVLQCKVEGGKGIAVAVNRGSKR